MSSTLPIITVPIFPNHKFDDDPELRSYTINPDTGIAKFKDLYNKIEKLINDIISILFRFVIYTEKSSGSTDQNTISIKNMIVMGGKATNKYINPIKNPPCRRVFYIFSSNHL